MATERVPQAELPRTPEQIEREWYENVYAGDRMPQLTIRALVMGMLLGGVMSLSNVYIGLKAGWSLGVAITSSILAYAIFAALHRAIPRWFPSFSILERASCASASVRVDWRAARVKPYASVLHAPHLRAGPRSEPGLDHLAFELERQPAGDALAQLLQLSLTHSGVTDSWPSGPAKRCRSNS